MTVPAKTPHRFRSCAEAESFLRSRLGTSRASIATPLGLGKPNELLNLLYARAKTDPSYALEIFTALSLNPPVGRASSTSLEARFLGPFSRRQWGEAYPALEYARDSVAGKLPANVRVHEFYFQAGAALHSPRLQQDYVSLNYTHVAQAVHARGAQAILQLVAKRTEPDGRERYSLSSNPDLTLDVADLYRRNGQPLLVIGAVHPDLPFLGGEAEVDAGFFDAIVEAPADSPELKHALFALPRSPIEDADHLIGFHASRLVRDGGTLQIGIGSLSDSVVASLVLRHRDPPRYARIAQAIGRGREWSASLPPEEGSFREGLYGLSEMVMDGFMHLRKAGILRREVVDESSGIGTFLHGAFFLGSKDFYGWLRELAPEDFRGIRMTRVSKVNDLYDPNELVLRRQRKHPRFLNTCMQATLLGGAASDTLPDGRTVSGVGGQYNFVAMAHELPDALSVLQLRSTRESQGKRASSIVASHAQQTIPRHLRGIVVTEYGVADLRHRSDEECVRAMLGVADAEFQEELADEAKRSGKLERGYRIPAWARENTPARLAEWIAFGRAEGAFAPFPFGSDFTPPEERLALALGRLRREKERSVFALASLWRSGGEAGAARTFATELSRMALAVPSGLSERVFRRLLLGALVRESAERGGARAPA